jgi:hypothetical protein
MSLRCLFRLSLAGATLAAGVVFAAPASAAVQYDPASRTGFVGAADVRRAFGWTAAMLAARAGGVAFDHDFWTDDTYSVVCGKRTYPVVHHKEYGHYELTEAVVRGAGARSAAGYGGGITGFRLGGATSGISGTSVAPAVGQPCPTGKGPGQGLGQGAGQGLGQRAGQGPGRGRGQDPRQGATIDELRLVSSATGWALAARSGEVSHRILTGGRGTGPGRRLQASGS